MSESTASEAPQLLDLASDRVIVLHDRNCTFRLTCRRVQRADWLAYFAAIVISSEQQGSSRATSMDFDTPRKLLAERVLVDAQGYAVAGGGKLTDVPNWQTKIPLNHRLELGRVLSDVQPSEAESGYTIFLEGEEVSIDAVWSSLVILGDGVTEDFAMRKFVGLKHVLKTPTEAQYKRYNQQASRSLVVGGSRSGRTIYAGAYALLCELYDELVISVDGYSVAGVPLTGPPSQIIGQMDLHHKFTAAQELFAPRRTAFAAGAEGEGQA